MVVLKLTYDGIEVVGSQELPQSFLARKIADRDRVHFVHVPDLDRWLPAELTAQLSRAGLRLIPCSLGHLKSTNQVLVTNSAHKLQLEDMTLKQASVLAQPVEFATESSASTTLTFSVVDTDFGCGMLDVESSRLFRAAFSLDEAVRVVKVVVDYPHTAKGLLRLDGPENIIERNMFKGKRPAGNSITLSLGKIGLHSSSQSHCHRGVRLFPVALAFSELSDELWRALEKSVVLVQEFVDGYEDAVRRVLAMNEEGDYRMILDKIVRCWFPNTSVGSDMRLELVDGVVRNQLLKFQVDGIRSYVLPAADLEPGEVRLPAYVWNSRTEADGKAYTRVNLDVGWTSVSGFRTPILWEYGVYRLKVVGTTDGDFVEVNPDTWSVLSQGDFDGDEVTLTPLKLSRLKPDRILARIRNGGLAPIGNRFAKGAADDLPLEAQVIKAAISGSLIGRAYNSLLKAYLDRRLGLPVEDDVLHRLREAVQAALSGVKHVGLTQEVVRYDGSVRTKALLGIVGKTEWADEAGIDVDTQTRISRAVSYVDAYLDRQRRSATIPLEYYAELIALMDLVVKKNDDDLAHKALNHLDTRQFGFTIGPAQRPIVNQLLAAAREAQAHMAAGSIDAAGFWSSIDETSQSLLGLRLSDLAYGRPCEAAKENKKVVLAFLCSLARLTAGRHQRAIVEQDFEPVPLNDRLFVKLAPPRLLLTAKLMALYELSSKQASRAAALIMQGIPVEEALKGGE